MNPDTVFLFIGQLFQFFSAGTVPHDQEFHILPVHPPEVRDNFFYIFFFGKPSQNKKYLFPFFDSVFFPYFPSVTLHSLPAHRQETLQPYTGGNHRNRTIHAIGIKNPLYLLGGSNNKICFFQNKPGKPCGSLLSPGPARAEIMGIIFIYRMIGMDNGYPQLCRYLPGNQEAAEFTLGMDDIRLPCNQLLIQPASRKAYRPGSGINPAYINRTHVIDILLLVGVSPF